MSEATKRICDILTYIEQVEKLKIKPAFAVPTEPFTVYQHEMLALSEMALHETSETDEVWLRVPRLQEVAVPPPDEVLRPWVNLPKSPERAPELKPEIADPQPDDEHAMQSLASRPDIQALFDWYLENMWRPWATAEAPRRRTMALYATLFTLQQTLSSEGADAALELVWGMGMALWRHPESRSTVKYPLLTQACELTLNEDSFDLEVRPRDVDPRMELDCYSQMEVAGVRPLEMAWKGQLASGLARPNPFEPESFEGALHTAVGHLDALGTYVACDGTQPLPVPQERLQVTGSWVLFFRKRSTDLFLEDARRLKDSAKACTELPGALRGLVEHGDSVVKVQPEVPYRGLSSSSAASGAQELYFPMPYNDEQVAIVQKLANNDGVVVQGPPGTGKTHTIANVICHYLALGKRVLVTANGESALGVVQEKIPESIRPLCVALLANERDGKRQFEHAVQTIAAKVASINPAVSEKNIGSLEAALDNLHASIARVDRAVEARAREHMRTYAFQGEALMAEDLAKRVLAQAETHEWFDDAPPTEPPVTLADDDVHQLRAARMAVRGDLAYLGKRIPGGEVFIAWDELLALHRDLGRAKAIEDDVSHGTLLPLVDATPETFERAQALLSFLEERAQLVEALAAPELAWTHALLASLRQLTAAAPGRAAPADAQAGDVLVRALQRQSEQILALEEERKAFIPKAIVLPEQADQHSDFVDAVQRAAEGKSPFAFFFGKAEARKLIAQVTLAGQPPTSAAQWQDVAALLAWRQATAKARLQWNAMAEELAVPTVQTNPPAPFRELAPLARAVQSALTLALHYEPRLAERVASVLVRQAPDQPAKPGKTSLSDVVKSLRAHVTKGQLAYARAKVQALLAQLAGCEGPASEQLQQFLTLRLGTLGADEAAMAHEWQALRAEVLRLALLAPQLQRIARVAQAIELAGAPQWAQRLRTLPARADADEQAPLSWRDAWQWRLAVQQLDSIDSHQFIRTLFEERRTLTRQLSQTYQDLVAEKTWLGVYYNSPEDVRQALSAYLTAVQLMGSGTGVRAARYRKDARAAMARAYRAVPCWILPQWRVSEALPSEVGLFDLVIIDEASQSDIWAFPALMRGKKHLVVGDNRQVSPSAVGVAEDRIRKLIERFLADQPHGAQMTPEKSIYDLATVVFAGNSVMLREHFRCSPAIIEFSNREFYQGNIVPLRVPKANERLDPPLIDVRVLGATRTGDVNKVEARAIVQEIEALIADPAMAGRSIGVVTLLGTAQAKLIYELITARVGPNDMISHKISVGPPAVFQGRERDIMMVSMVLAPGCNAMQNRVDQAQRVNVAMSRARDRLYLFRSVGDTEFREDSLSGRVISHFKKPFSQDAGELASLRELCQSGFEREVYDALVQRGFRVRPQVPSGGFFIDFVVEGKEGRRLAIECDGDRFHGPDKWREDMERQRVLERAGWTFWRSFASSFVRRRQEVLDDLLATLHRHGIEPLGSDAVDNTQWVQYREVDPLLGDTVDASPAAAPQAAPGQQLVVDLPELALHASDAAPGARA